MSAQARRLLIFGVLWAANLFGFVYHRATGWGPLPLCGVVASSLLFGAATQDWWLARAALVSAADTRQETA